MHRSTKVSVVLVMVNGTEGQVSMNMGITEKGGGESLTKSPILNGFTS